MKRLVVALVVTAVLGSLVAAGGAGVSAATGNTTANNTTTSDGPGFGASVSAFMATSAEDANGSVDQGMWEAEMNRTPAAERAAARVRTLQARLDRLAERRAALLAAHRNGTISDVAFRARMAAIAASYERLATSANATQRTSRSHGVSPPGVDDLVANATAAAEHTHGPPGLDLSGNGTWPPTTDAPGTDRGPGNVTTGPGEHGPGNDTPGGDGAAGVGNRTTGAGNVTTGNGGGNAPDGHGGPPNGSGNATGGSNGHGPGHESISVAPHGTTADS